MSKDRRTAEFNVSKLTSYLDLMLENTNIVRKSVSESCEETRKVVMCWTFPDKDEDLINDSTSISHVECTCHISAFDESSEEIAKGIGDIVENAQKLREKISAKKPPTKQISNKLTSTAKGISANYRSGSAPSVPVPGGARNGLSNTSIPKLSSSRAISKNTIKNPPSVPRLKSVPSTQSTYQKDFVASRPSSRLSNGSAKSTASHVNGTMKKSGDGPITMAQLEELLDRVAVDATLYSSQTKVANVVDTPPSLRIATTHPLEPPTLEDCPLHGSKVPVQKIQLSAKRVEFKEAISIHGVPSRLVKILQPYHRFLSKHENGEKPIEPKSATKFLTELNNMNKSSWDEAMCEPLAGAFANYLPLCSKVSQLTGTGEKVSPKDISRIRLNLEKLDTAYRNCLGKEISASNDPPLFNQRQEACIPDLNHSALALGGIWNDRSISFQGMADALCIRYNNVKQIKRFYHNVQRIQRLDFQSNLLDLIAKEIMPRLCQIDDNHATYFLMVKTLIALCDLEHFKMPIIVKND